MLTGYGNIPTAVAAIKEGAIDYLAKPADAEDVEKALFTFHTFHNNQKPVICETIFISKHDCQ